MRAAFGRLVEIGTGRGAPTPEVEPYKCCAPRADGSRNWFCQGMMRPRGFGETRTMRYRGELMVELECGSCHRTAYQGENEIGANG